MNKQYKSFFHNKLRKIKSFHIVLKKLSVQKIGLDFAFFLPFENIKKLLQEFYINTFPSSLFFSVTKLNIKNDTFSLFSLH